MLHSAGMAQYRQSGGVHGLWNGVVPDHLSIGVRGGPRRLQVRRSNTLSAYRISIAALWVLTLFLTLSMSPFFYFKLQLQNKGEEMNRHQSQDDNMGEMGIDADFLSNVTRTQKSKDFRFGHGRDSHYWDRDGRRRDSDYSEDKLEQSGEDSVDNAHVIFNSKHNKSSYVSHQIKSHQGNGLYNEAGRKELKLYEAEYEASLNDRGKPKDVRGERNQLPADNYGRNHRALDDTDEYDDGMDIQDDAMEEYNDVGNGETDPTGATTDTGKSSHSYHAGNKNKDKAKEANKASSDLYGKTSQSDTQNSEGQNDFGNVSIDENQHGTRLISGKRSVSKKKSKNRKFSGSCEMKLMDSSALLVEPLEGRKFARFSLHYTEKEEKPIKDEGWESRFAGHQSLKERDESFLAQDKTVNCGFVKGPVESPSTGFDLAENDAKYMSSCHIAVISCIFGNSDRLRSPSGRTVSRYSRKNVCFVMFVDEVTFQTLSTEGQMPDIMGFIGLWKIVVVKNLPYTDMRRVGKIPKFLAHRLFSSARYSIWLDSKLRLQLDPLVILEYFLWRKGYEYAISNHYDRHCLWQEVAQNKKLNKYNHSIIDEQFAFYQSDGMKRFNASDPDKLLPSNVPEGSFIVRAHTPMSNLFSCLWFNEVERFTPRDQLSFAYTYHKLRWMNPDKPFYLHMFKDCERRKIAKLYHHRTPERKINLQQK